MPTTLLALVALRGLRAWQPQAQGQRAIERAEDCLVALHEVISLIRAARTLSIRGSPEDAHTSDKLQHTFARICNDDLQHAWESWQRFNAAYRRASFFIVMPQPDCSEVLASVLTKLSELARRIDTYERHDPRFQAEAKRARAQFLGYGDENVDEKLIDTIEQDLESSLKTLEAVLLRHTSSNKFHAP